MQFKPEHSATHCIFVIQETVEHYFIQNSACYAILIDVAKAFNRVQCMKLFEIVCTNDIHVYVMQL